MSGISLWPIKCQGCGEVHQPNTALLLGDQDIEQRQWRHRHRESCFDLVPEGQRHQQFVPYYGEGNVEPKVEPDEGGKGNDSAT